MDPLRTALSTLLAPLLDAPPEEVASSLSIPPKPDMGDLALPVFRWAKAKGKKPPEFASELAARVPTGGLVARAGTAGPYLNLELDPGAAGRVVLDPILADPVRYAAAPARGQRVVIDFSSPNVAKPFHIGHLHGTVLGNSLVRILRHLGWEVIGVNHLGDWGTQFGRAAVAFDLWGDEAELEAAVESATGARYLVSLYVKFHDEADAERTRLGLAKGVETPLETRAREWFRDLEAGSTPHRQVWQRFVDVSLAEFQAIYGRIGVGFDHYTGESFYTDRMEPAIARLQAAGVLSKSEGAEIVEVGEDIPPFLVRKSDGATLYGTRDLAAALYRLDTFDPARILYVVGAPQKLHFEQLFRTLEKLIPGVREKLVHVDYAHTRFRGRAMKTRSGDVVYLQDVLEEAASLVREKLEANKEAKGDYLREDPEVVAWRIALSSLVFGYLRPDRAKEVIFDWATAFDFEGDTGPGVQYSHAQLRSILKKAGPAGVEPDWALLTEPDERNLVRLLSDFAGVVEAAGESFKPSGIAGHLLELRSAVNSYLHRKDLPKIKDLEGRLKASRLGLVRATAEVLALGLSLLGIQATEQM